MTINRLQLLTDEMLEDPKELKGLLTEDDDPRATKLRP